MNVSPFGRHSDDKHRHDNSPNGKTRMSKLCYRIFDLTGTPQCDKQEDPVITAKLQDPLTILGRLAAPTCGDQFTLSSNPA